MIQFFTNPVCLVLVALPLSTSPVSAQEQIVQYGHQSDWNLPIKLESNSTPRVVWSNEVGDGRSQIVGSGDLLLVASATNQTLDDKSIQLNERLEAINCRTGVSVWSREEASQMLKGQENYSGTPAAPQATPLIADGKVVCIGFTGIMQCLELETGKSIWKKSLVKDFGAKPVQFGFAASPVMDPSRTDRFFVMAAGPEGGLICLKLATGELIWRAPCDSFSYATPTFAEFANVPQILIVSENELIGIARDDGKRLWSHELAKKGLTNVPSPLVLDSERVLISGQGCNGVRCLKITRQGSDWMTRELWYVPKVKFFYQNWLKLTEDFVIGCNDKFLAVIDLRDGSLLGRWRGFADANLVSIDGGMIALTGQGNLKFIRPIMESDRISGLENWAEFEVLRARCWTPLTLVNGMLIARGGTSMIGLSISTASEPDAPGIKNQRAAPEVFKFSRK
jgi:outer membrane protein assembly factor BamB